MEQQSSSNHIDKNVIFIMLGTLLLASMALIAKVANHDPCNIMNFEVNASQFRVGEIIRFKDYSENVTERQWSFGDSTDYRYTENPFHTYTTPGTYTVELLVNDNCSVSKEIVIKEKLDIIDSTRIAKFKVPTKITVGELLSVTDLTKKATSWEWRFGETSEVNSTFQNPTYTYQTPGLKTITLIVNGDPRYSTQRRITVLPKEEEEQVVELSNRQKRRTLRQENRDRESLIKYDPVVTTTPSVPISEAPKSDEKPVKRPQISRSAFAKKIIQVSEEKATADDFKPYMCGNLQTMTMIKGKKTTFLEFCEKIKGKKIKIKSLALYKNEKNKCIEYISIDYSKSFF